MSGEKPPAETQQDDVDRVAAALEAVAIRDLGPAAGFPMEDYARAAIAALAARPTADTEKLPDLAEAHYAGMQAVRAMPSDWYCPRSEPDRRRRDCPECVAEVALDAALAIVYAESSHLRAAPGVQ